MTRVPTGWTVKSVSVAAEATFIQEQTGVGSVFALRCRPPSEQREEPSLSAYIAAAAGFSERPMGGVA